MTINEFIRKYRKFEEFEVTSGLSKQLPWTPHVICNDDFEFSAQASYTHYSEPRAMSDEYTQVEIGYPSLNDRIIAEYREDYGWEEGHGLTNPVYPYVPVEVVDELIAYHGGINEDAVRERIAEMEKRTAA